LSIKAPNTERLLGWSITIGIADFVIAVALGILMSPGVFHLYALDAPNIINDYPSACLTSAPMGQFRLI